MKHGLPLVLAAFTIVATACAPSVGAAAEIGATAQPVAASSTPNLPVAPATPAAGDLTRVDDQGAVMVEVTPLDLGAASQDLRFEVALNTHSVNLGMDLASLASLSTDTGVTVQAVSWDGPVGGHHVNGTLTFPASKDGNSILQGASAITLTIVNVDAAARVFTWQLQ